MLILEIALGICLAPLLAMVIGGVGFGLLVIVGTAIRTLEWMIAGLERLVSRIRIHWTVGLIGLIAWVMFLVAAFITGWMG